VLENSLCEEAAQAKFRHPKQTQRRPVGLLHVRFADAASLLDDRHAVAFFAQAQRGDTAAKSRTDDEDVVVHDSFFKHKVHEGKRFQPSVIASRRRPRSNLLHGAEIASSGRAPSSQ
jgi:hypothetical protein